MEAIALSALLIVVGMYFGLRNIRLLLSEAALLDYLQSSPKGRRWVEKFGISRAMMITKNILPLGIAMSIAMVGMGMWTLYKVLL